jgi:hypothetical protein
LLFSRSMRRSGPLLVLALAGACAAPRLEVPAPTGGWKAAPAREGGVAYHHAKAGGTIAANRTCEDVEDVPLDVLTNHLLIGVEERKEASRRPLTVAGRGALRTRLDGKIDGVPVGLDLVVLKKDGCVYDLMLVGSPQRVEALAPEFERFVARFAPEARR